MSDQARFQLGDFWLALRGATWCISWFDKASRQTRRASTGLRDFEEAKRSLAHHVIKHSKPDSQAPEDVPVVHVLDTYYNEHAAALPSGGYARYALGYWQKEFGDSSVADCTPARLEAFATRLAGLGTLSGGTVNRILAVGRAALQRAHRRGVVARPVFVPTVKQAPPKMLRATQAQVAALLNATDGDLGHIRTWLFLSIGTLARPEAVLELTREQCDFDLGRIDLNQPGRTQSRKVRPIVPMVPTIRALLERTETGVVTRYRGEPLVDVRMGFQRARQRAGLPAGITPYTIRRTMASELRRRGVPPWEIAGFLGHSARDFRTTEVYAEYAPDYLGAAGAAIEAYFEELAPLLDFELPRAGDKPALSTARDTARAKHVPFLPQVVDLRGNYATMSRWDSTTELRAFVPAEAPAWAATIVYKSFVDVEYKDLQQSACQLRYTLRASDV